MTEKKIAWEKWEDHSLESVVTVDEDSMEEPSEENGMDIMALLNTLPHIVSTPMGMYHFDDRMRPSKQYDCWTGHTNFDITDDIKNQIEKIPGVEVLLILTRYRFFLGIGRLFNFREVRVRIDSAVCSNNSDFHFKEGAGEVMDESLESVKEEVSAYKYWAIFVFPNGEMDYVSTNSESDENYLNKLLLYTQAKLLSDGILIQSE